MLLAAQGQLVAPINIATRNVDLVSRMAARSISKGSMGKTIMTFVKPFEISSRTPPLYGPIPPNKIAINVANPPAITPIIRELRVPLAS
jgi:hypothetical protein